MDQKLNEIENDLRLANRDYTLKAERVEGMWGFYLQSNDGKDDYDLEDKFNFWDKEIEIALNEFYEATCNGKIEQYIQKGISEVEEERKCLKNDYNGSVVIGKQFAYSGGW